VLPAAIRDVDLCALEIQALQMRIPLMWILVLLSGSPLYAANEEFPPQVRGLWAITKETCAILKTKSPADLGPGQRWLKLTATDVLGTTQARFLRQKKAPTPMAGDSPLKFLFEVQMADSFGLIGELSFKGDTDLYLYETIVGAHSSRSYEKC
jgi:hypothetical protein